jgi:hypothetical protein
MAVQSYTKEHLMAEQNTKSGNKFLIPVILLVAAVAVGWVISSETKTTADGTQIEASADGMNSIAPASGSEAPAATTEPTPLPVEENMGVSTEVPGEEVIAEEGEEGVAPELLAPQAGTPAPVAEEMKTEGEKAMEQTTEQMTEDAAKATDSVEQAAPAPEAVAPVTPSPEASVEPKADETKTPAPAQ